MKVDVSTQIVIQRERGEVAAFAMNPDNVPRWYQNIKSVEWKSAAPLRVGSRIAFVAEFLGRRLAYTYEVKELVPGERLVMQTSEGPFPMQTSYYFEPAAGGTRMTLRNRGDATGFAALLTPFMAMAVRRANKKDLQRLRQVLESAER